MVDLLWHYFDKLSLNDFAEENEKSQTFIQFYFRIVSKLINYIFCLDTLKVLEKKNISNCLWLTFTSERHHPSVDNNKLLWSFDFIFQAR